MKSSTNKVLNFLDELSNLSPDVTYHFVYGDSSSCYDTFEVHFKFSGSQCAFFLLLKELLLSDISVFNDEDCVYIYCFKSNSK